MATDDKDDAAKRATPPTIQVSDDKTPAKDAQATPTAEQESGKPGKQGLRDHPLLLAAAAVLFVVVAVGGLLWWLNARNYESTDDAFIDTHIVRLAPQIAGRVTRVFVNDNQPVKAGQPVVEIDSADVETRVAQARAQKSQAQAQVDNALVQIRVNEASLRQSRADLRASAAQASNAAVDFARYERLQTRNPQAVAEQQFDQARTTAVQAAAQRDSAAEVTRTRAAQVAAARTQVAAGRDQVRAAQAQLDEAGVNYNYTRLAAPVDGHVSQKTVEVGAYVQPGSQILAIVPLEMWVTANFKETQLAHMRRGQAVTVKVDACPASHVRGHVDSIQRGAGQAFGILPPENATGNYVKVVQRVPVKIILDTVPPECPLGPGLSVEPTVRVR